MKRHWMPMLAGRRAGQAQRPLMTENSPWGGGGDGKDGPRNPWTRPTGVPPSGSTGGSGGDSGGRNPSAMDQAMERLRGMFGGGLPGGPGNRSLWVYGIGAILVIWLLTTAFHSIGPQQRGIVTFLGSFSRTLTPGIGLTLPAPFENVMVIDVEEIRTVDIGSNAENPNLVLTGDENIIDLAYSVRWNIRSPERFAFQLADPEQTISEVAESAMRAAIANVKLNDALGPGRIAIEGEVRERMQDILDGYQSGVLVQGVAIKQADPPDEVNDAFKEVSAAQQTAQTYLNEARAYAQQLTAKAQGESAAFDKVYVQYRLAPEVTRRRMYYETMEQVLGNVDKTVVEARGVTPYLPLPELGRRQPSRPAGGDTQEQAQ